MENNKIAKLHLGEVITCPIDFVVDELKMLAHGRPMVKLYNEEFDLDINVYNEQDLEKLLGGNRDESSKHE